MQGSILAGMLAALILILIVIGIGYAIASLVPMSNEKVRMIFWLVILVICLLVLLGAVEGRTYFRVF